MSGYDRFARHWLAAGGDDGLVRSGMSVLQDAARLATSIAGARYAAVTLLDDDYIWFAACDGFDVEKVERRGSFCDRTVSTGDMFVIEDAKSEPDFRDAAFVVGELRMRYYAGLPLMLRDGRVVGTLCVGDPRPSLEVTAERYRHLSLLAEITMDRLSGIDEELQRRELIEARRDASTSVDREIDEMDRLIRHLADRSRHAELAVDAAMQGVRQLVGLDREVHADLLAHDEVASLSTFPKLMGKLALHAAISSTVEEDADALVRDAASLRVEASALVAPVKRLRLLAEAAGSEASSELGTP